VAVARGRIRLLYIAPERLLLPGTQELVRDLRVPLVAIDEAHCISQWGHDFRPEYRDLARLRDLCPHATLTAFTATATRRVEADIIRQLSLRPARRSTSAAPPQQAPASRPQEGPQVFRGSFNRPNLFYSVRPKKGAFQQVAEYCLRRPDSSGIVYCLSRSSTEDVAERLSSAGVSAQAYHAGLDAETRRTRQEAFQSGKTRVMVATIAFGMGIDKPDVRFVIHYDMPQHLEGYYQETGRAGRDGKPSDCILFYTYADVRKFEGFIAKKPMAEQEVARRQLKDMTAWAESASCRRERLLGYFDEVIQAGQRPAACCDRCVASGPKERDCTVPAQKLLSCAKRTGEAFGLVHLVRVLRGSNDQRIFEAGHDRLPVYGIGKDMDRMEWRRLADALVEDGCFSLEGPERAAQVTPKGEEVLFKGRRVVLTEQPAAHEVVQALEPVRQPGPILPAGARLTPTHRETLRLFQEGKSLTEIAAERGLAESTVTGHLAEALTIGEPIALDKLVSAAKQASIREAIAAAGGAFPLRPIKDRLGEEYSYGEIRLVAASVEAACPTRDG
jgi:ATP-dependent DNA helicase RecQ